MKILIYLMGLVALGSCGENSVSINVKNPINEISESFISFKVNFFDLMTEFVREKSLDKLNMAAPAFIKIDEFSTYLKNEKEEQFSSNDVASLFELLMSSELTPVFVIDYSSFDPLSLLRDFKAARNLKINKCVWQLGDNSVPTISKQYSEDLKTLQIFCESVNKEHNMNWNVAGDSSVLQLRNEKLPFEIAAYEAMKIPEIEIIKKSNSISRKSQAPSWITVEGHHEEDNATSCEYESLISGLLHAQVLGEAANKGYNVLFFSEAHNTTGHKFKRAVSTLHKNLIGSKVFNVRVTKSLSDGKMTNLYAHCSKKTPGALTLMGINFSNMRAKFNVRLSSAMDPNAILVQYLLSSSDGNVYLNNEIFNSEAIPAYKFKKLSKLSIPLILPPFSMAFWTIKNAKVNECLNVVEVKTNKVEDQLTSSSTDQLIKKLVANELETKKVNSIEKKIRNRRQIGFLPPFELELPTFKFPSLLAPASSPKTNRDTFFNTNSEVNPLRSSENPTLPKGDVYFLINDGKKRPVAGSLDYIIDDHEQAQQPKSSRKKQNRVFVQEPTESPDYFMPYDYVDASVKTTKKSTKKSSKQEKPKEIGELFEAERVIVGRGNDQKSLGSSNVELKTVIRELEPTYRQSKSAMQAARRKWDSDSLKELLQDAELEDFDKSQLSDTEDFELIDLTENVQSPNYEEYEEDDDDFFDDQLHHIRTKRSFDFSKNEIPKYGVHVFDDDEDSIESLIHDVPLYMQPRSEIQDIPKSDEAATKSSSSTEQPLTIKAVDFLSQSLGDVILVAHKHFIGWWNVFNPIEY